MTSSRRVASHRRFSWRSLRRAVVAVVTLGSLFEAVIGPPPARADAPVPAASTPLSVGAGAEPSDAARTPELRHFYDALAALARHQRNESVRVLWLGDSHTASDFLTGAVRSRLVERYGSGGPGFLRLGVPVRHDLATFERSGRFRIQPESPATRLHQDDGVFGFGGMRVTPLSDGARLGVRLAPRSVRGRAKFTLLYDVKLGGEFAMRLGSTAVNVRGTEGAQRVAGSPVLRRSIEGEPSEPFSVEVRRGRPRFYGLFVDGSEPGVVVDTVGINGARVATALAWAEAPFAAEVLAREPELVVMAFGTNEAFDELRVSAYEAQLAQLLRRLRQRPNVDCLVLGPPDALAPSGEPAARVAEITRVYASSARTLGCAFVSAQALMGGPGAFASWQRQDPQLASADRVHLTPKGYRKLGELVFDALFAGAAPAEATNAP
ncbi:MAG TPA: GDSL-type esterase/lipase family protein [Polyangiaceae bacterium]|nr:GDSL-type esterase/lipase family protein [Polyangiaceae bacterium]